LDPCWRTESVDSGVHVVRHFTGQLQGANSHGINGVFNAPNTHIADVSDFVGDSVGEAADEGAATREDDVVSEDLLVFGVGTGHDLLDGVANLGHDQFTRLSDKVADVNHLPLSFNRKFDGDFLVLFANV
jgi:hypothetical protein